MIRIVVIPTTSDEFYSGLAKKEKELQTFYRAGPKKVGQQKWKHIKYQGWMHIQKAFGGVTVACVQAKNAEEEWKILSAFIGLLDRHFRDSISNINISYETQE